LRTKYVWWSALPVLAAAPTVARAQDAPAPLPATSQDQIVEFSADQLIYDGDADLVTASGEVRMNREGNYLAADEVTWNR
jgi:LPS-assembly protein